MWKTIVSSSSCCNLWSSKSTLSVLSTKSVKPESCWKRTGGSIGKVELTHRSYFSNFNDCYCILYFRLFFWSPGYWNWMFFLSCSFLPVLAFQHPSEQGVPVTCTDHETVKSHFHGTPHQQSRWNNGVCPNLLPTWKKGISIQCSGLRADCKGTRKVEKAEIIRQK